MKKIEDFQNEICAIPPKRIYVTFKIDVFYIENIRSNDLLDLKDYDSKQKRFQIYISDKK